MTRTWTCATSLAALALAAPLVLAQQSPEDAGDRLPQNTEQKGDSGGASRGGPPPNEKAGAPQREAGDAPTDSDAETADDAAKRSRAERTQSGDADQSRESDRKAGDDAAADRKARKQTGDERTAGDRAREQRDDRKGAQRDDRERDDSDKSDDKSDRRADDRKRDRTNFEAEERGPDRASGEVKQEDRQKAEQVRSKVDQKERERVRDVAFRGDVRRASGVDVRIDLGVRLPRSVVIYDLPPDVIAIVPAYRGYRYVVIDDAYCIVDPDTYVIVDVIHRGARLEEASGPGGGARLKLTDDQIEIIRREVHDRGRAFDYEGDLEVGIRLPGDISFEPFPDVVVRDVPVVREYRFARLDDEIAIVAADQPEVVYVIDD